MVINGTSNFLFNLLFHFMGSRNALLKSYGNYSKLLINYKKQIY